jgi:hypothetical protein
VLKSINFTESLNGPEDIEKRYVKLQLPLILTILDGRAAARTSDSLKIHKNLSNLSHVYVIDTVLAPALEFLEENLIANMTTISLSIINPICEIRIDGFETTYKEISEI